MKKTIILITSLIILYLISAFLRAYLADKAAEEFASESLKSLSNPWNEQAILERLSPEYKTASRTTLHPFVEQHEAKWGSLREIHSTTCKLGENLPQLKPNNVYAACKITATFDKAKVKGKILLILKSNTSLYQKNNWLVDYLRLEEDQ